MKSKLQVLFLAIVLGFGLSAKGQLRTNLIFSWDKPTNTIEFAYSTNFPGGSNNWYFLNNGSTNLTYRIYSLTNFGGFNSTNIIFWNLFSVASNTVGNGSRLQYTNVVRPDAYLFTMTSSNFWGESFFSAPVATPAVSPVINNLLLEAY